MAVEREFICTACPKGCLLRVVMEGKDVVKMEGYKFNKFVASVYQKPYGIPLKYINYFNKL